MPQTQAAVEVLRRYIDPHFDSHTPVLALHWQDSSEQMRVLPAGLTIVSSPPQQFGLQVRRHSADGYAVHLLWDETRFSWPDVSRRDLLGSCLGALLAAIDVDLWSLLEQPIRLARPRPRAA